jgi:hypothetical protein
MKKNSNLTETILYPLPKKLGKQTMLQIHIECIELDLPKEDWHYNQLEHNKETGTWWFTADEAPNVVTRTAEGMTILRCFSFSLHSEGTSWRFLEVRHTFSELPADPVQLLLNGENYENDPQVFAVVKNWFSIVDNIKDESGPISELLKALYDSSRLS